MQAVFTWLFTIYFFATSAILFIVNAIICVLAAPFDPLRRAVHWFSCYWGFHYLQIVPFWKVDFEGVENIDPKKTYILVANHQSVADIVILYGLHRFFKWVSKVEIIKVPFIGWNMWLNQYVLLKRGDIKSIKEMLHDCQQWLSKGASIMLFPEGTRSEDGNLQSFRDGAFKLSLDNKVDLVPILIDGSLGLLPKGGKLLGLKQTVRVKVLPPVSPLQYAGQPGKMRAYVHDLMSDTLAQMRGQKPRADANTLARCD